MVSDLVERLRALLDAPGFLTGADIGERYLNTRGHGIAGAPLCVLRPTSTAQVSAIMALCHSASQPVIAQGGMTGLVGGGAPRGNEVVISLERMDGIEQLDRDGRTLIAGAGLVLQRAQEYCDANGFLLPLDLGARGSATLGGVIATNAGGVRVIRYGMMRESVLGLEAVLADGTIISSMNKMLKNNAGYDLKHLFIGSEGTLGIVTRAVVRLRPKPKSIGTAFCGVATFANVLALLRHLEESLGGDLASFEVMWADYDNMVRTLCFKLRPPLAEPHAYTVIVESLGRDPKTDAAHFESVLAAAMETGIVADAAIAQSDRQRAEFWAIREDAGEGFRKLAPLFTYDVSMPIPTMEDFGNRIKAETAGRYPGSTVLVLGHLGDGNLHVVASVGRRDDDAHKAVNDIVYGVIRDLGGSVSAEHGIGVEKRDYLSWSRTPEEIALMRTLKAALDPRGLLNPGKVL